MDLYHLSTTCVACFQEFDVFSFGRLKSAKTYLARDDNLDSHKDHAFCFFGAYKIATTSTAMRRSWEKAGFGSMRCDGTCYLWVDEGKIRTSSEFVGIWQVDYPEERLS
jgi:hypothetical protein